MPSVLCIYIDDSGARHPDKDPGNVPAHGYDYFALGGILVKEEDEDMVKDARRLFCEKWQINAPLHSSEIRGRTGSFAWIGRLSSRNFLVFHEELYQLLKDLPVLGIACVVDRPGYNERYKERYGEKRWMLCKTAFSVVVERSAKYAQNLDRKLRVLPERCNEKEDKVLRQYYQNLKSCGMPFSQNTSAKYQPLTAEDLNSTLYDFKPKYKSSGLAQIADLYLWPMCMGGYHLSNRPYQRLMDDGKLIDCILDEGDIPHLGIKYSCFDLVERKP
ncbi:MAG: DUF3800 domain-containing protein [Proteobacteria bacterium]|nr:DUF3800 domain-containing protein [Pseudomonadota bacterium]